MRIDEVQHNENVLIKIKLLFEEQKGTFQTGRMMPIVAVLWPKKWVLGAKMFFACRHLFSKGISFFVKSLLKSFVLC